MTYSLDFPNHNPDIMNSETTFIRTGSRMLPESSTAMRSFNRTLTSLITWQQRLFPAILPSARPLLRRLLMLVLLPAFVAAMGTPQTAAAQPAGNPAPDAHIVPNPYPELDEYLNLLLEKNPELGEYRHRYRSERQIIPQAGVLPDPELNIAFDLNPMDAGSVAGRFSVSAMQMFPWFGTLSSRQDQQRASAEATRQQMNSRQLALWREMQSVWMELAGLARAIDIAEENLELVGDLERQVQVRYEGARAGQADLLRIQMEQERIRTRIAALKDRKTPLTARFNSYLNRDAGAGVSLSAELAARPLPADAGALRERMLAVRPEFYELDARRRMIREDEVQARLAGRPQFGLGLEVMGRDFGQMSMNPDMKESFIAMASIRLPIYRSQYSARREQSAEAMRSLEYRRESTENRLVTELEEVLESWRDTERTLTLLEEELLPRSVQALEILRESYATGAVRFDELLQMQRELLDLELERVDALVAQNQAVIRLQSLITHPSETETANQPGF